METAGAQSFDLIMPEVEATFRKQQRFFVLADLGIFTLAAFLVAIPFTGVPILPSRPGAPSHNSQLDVGLLLDAFIVPLGALLAWAVVRDAQARPQTLELSETGFSIRYSGGSSRLWLFADPKLSLTFMGTDGDGWGRPVASFRSFRMRMTFLPPGALSAICREATSSGLEAIRTRTGPLSYMVRIRPNQA